MRKKDLERILLASGEDVHATLADVEAEEEARKQHSWVADLIKVLAPHRHGLRRRIVIDAMWALRGPNPRLNVPRKFEQTVQSAFNRHCPQSDTYKLPPEDGIFHWPEGKGTGVWAVHTDLASAWLKARDLPDI
jgi:hypothetical protein